MTYKDKNVTYALNSYTWKLLQVNLGWTPWQGVPRIIPVSQQPEIMQSGEAFIVYGSASHPPGHLYHHKKEAVAYTIYSTSPTDVNRIIELLTDTFERQDEAASDVNDWLVEEGRPGNRSSGHRGVYFTSIKATMAEKAEDPAEEEAGYAAGLVLIEALYTEDINTTIQTTGFTYQ